MNISFIQGYHYQVDCTQDLKHMANAMHIPHTCLQIHTCVHITCTSSCWKSIAIITQTWFALQPKPIRKLSGLISRWRNPLVCMYSTLVICIHIQCKVDKLLLLGKPIKYKLKNTFSFMALSLYSLVCGCTLTKTNTWMIGYNNTDSPSDQQA